MNLLVTGASGFVGQPLCIEATLRGHAVHRAVRTTTAGDATGQCVVGDIDAQTDWQSALHGIDAVIHLAARVHVMHDTATDPIAAFREVNVAGTENLARQAAAAGVKRLVFVSSVKVNGEETSGNFFYDETSPPAPQDPYGISKWEAEQALHRVAQETGLEVVIIRPPLVYGPGVKGNFGQMLKVLRLELPLPLRNVHNRRSLLYVENLVDALIACAQHPAAVGQTYLISDGEDISTPELLRVLGAAMGRSARLFAFPVRLIKALAGMVGKKGQADRLLGSLRVDDSSIRKQLNWAPPFTLQQGLKKTAEWYRDL